MTQIELIQGDCLLEMQSMPTMGYDLVVTSPPFLDKEVPCNYYDWLDRFVTETRRLAPVVLMFNSSRRLVEICRRYDDIQAVLVWDKIFTLPAFKYEPIFVMTKQKIWGRGRIYRDCLRYRIPSRKVHINQNPVELYAELLRFFPKAINVLDPCMGSGTTGIACWQEHRNFTGIDNDESAFDVAENAIRTVVGCGNDNLHPQTETQVASAA